MSLGAIKSHLSANEIIKRLSAVLKSKVILFVSVDSDDRVEQACTDKEWRGHCIFITQKEDITIVENLSGCLGDLTQENWLELAKEDSLSFVEYNDAIFYAQLVEIRNGKLDKYCLFDPEDSIQESSDENITSWSDIASIADNDDDLFIQDDLGLLVVFSNKT